jgi:hypothetical protein
MRHRVTLLVMVLLISSLGFAGMVNAQGHKKMKRVKIRGTVERVEGREAYIRTRQGNEVRVMIGPESYWEERGYRMVPGQSISVSGWYPEDDHESFFAGSIAGPGFSFSLTNSSGMPFWVDQDEQRQSAPSYVIYRDWYGPQYNYHRPPRHDDARRNPAGHEDHDKKDDHGRRDH